MVRKKLQSRFGLLIHPLHHFVKNSSSLMHNLYVANDIYLKDMMHYVLTHANLSIKTQRAILLKAPMTPWYLCICFLWFCVYFVIFSLNFQCVRVKTVKLVYICSWIIISRFFHILIFWYLLLLNHPLMYTGVILKQVSKSLCEYDFIFLG